MYEISLESKHPKIFLKVRLNQLENIFQKSERIIKPEDIKIENTIEQFRTGVNILKPNQDNNDFIFIYSSSTFWDYFYPNLHKHLLGREFGKTLPKLDELNHNETSLKSVYFNNKFMDSIIKLYQDGTLIKVWSQSKLKSNDVLYIFFEDLTELYQGKEREEKIFNEASFPKLQINKEYNVLRVNKSFKNTIGFSKKELNKLGLNNFIQEYNPKLEGVKNPNDNLRLLFNKKEHAVLSEVKLKTKKSVFKCYNCYSRLINDDIVQIGFHDVTEFKKVQKEELNINNYFNQMQKLNKVALSLRYKNLVKWAPEIYEIMEIPIEKNKGYHDNFLYKYIQNNDENKIEKALKQLKYKNTTNCIFKVKTGKGNIKYLKSIFQYSYENGKKLIMGFVQEVTDEILIQKKAIKLQENFNLIEESSQIGISEYSNGKFSFTSQLYKMLGTNEDKYPSTIDIVSKYVISEDKYLFDESFKLTPENDVLDATYRICNENNELKYFYGKNKGIFNQKGELLKVLGFITDVTEETLTKKSAIDLKTNLKLMQKNSKIVISTYKKGVYTYTKEIYNILEIKKEDYENNINLLYKFACPEDKKKIIKVFHDFSPENPSQHLILKIKTPKGNIKYLENYVESEFNDKRKLIKLTGFIHEVTSIIKREKELEKVSEDRKLLLEEVHDRVKNNLQLILSFINIDSNYSDETNSKKIINKTKNRIQTMALTHEEIYQSDSLSNVNLKSFINKNLSRLFLKFSDGTISLNLNINHVELDMDRTIPLGLLINEVGINTIKYAFPNYQEGNFNLNLNIDGKIL